MKNIKLFIGFTLVLILAFTACENEAKFKNYATFSGNVENITSDMDSVLVFIPNGYRKTIVLNADGTFEDTLNITDGKYRFKIGDEYGNIYLKNNESLHLETDYKDFDQALKFSGQGDIVEKTQAETDKLHLILNYIKESNAKLPEEEFELKMDEFRESYAALKNKYNALDATFWKDSDESIEKNIESFSKYRANKAAIIEKYTGVASPSFAMENIEGEIVSLEDFEGKYIYLDVWATWCGPCKREIPALKRIEEHYQDTDLVVISMSIDEVQDKGKWEKFVKEENLQGVQIFAENAWNSEFIKALEIRSIPRFILIGPDGIIVSPDAPRPSDPELIEILNNLDI